MPALAPTTTPQSRTLWTSRKEGLTGVQSPSFDLGVWARVLSPALRMRFAARAASPLELDVTVERHDLAKLHEALSAAVGDPELEAFIQADLEALLPIFAATLTTTTPKSSWLRVRLDRVADNMCEKLHTDCLPLRLACTYAGLGTEWVDEVDADRSKLGSASAPVLTVAELNVAEANASVLRHDNALRRCGVGDVILLKGSEWSESEQGAIHRSPEFNGQARILLRIDEPEVSP